MGEPSRTSIPEAVTELSVPSVEVSAPKEVSAPFAEERVLTAKPVAPSSTVEVAEPTKLVPGFLVQRVPVSTPLSIVRGNVEFLMIYFPLTIFALQYFNLFC